jgi:hypothetical protein
VYRFQQMFNFDHRVGHFRPLRSMGVVANPHVLSE